MRRRDLPDRMPRHHIRDHTPRLQQPKQRHLHREQPRLRIHRLIQQPAITTQHHPGNRTAQMLDQAPRTPHQTPPRTPGTPPTTPAPIPTRCAPCPVKTNATFPPPSPTAPLTTPAAGSPAATAPNPASNSSRLTPVTTAR